MTEPPEIHTFGPHRVTRVLFVVPVVAAVIATVFFPEAWPTIPGTLLILAGMLRLELRLTDTELVLRGLLGSTRIPRSEIAFARFDYKPLGVYLDIHRHNGQVDHLRFEPKPSSSELSGDPPPPDSAAYQITRWAEAARPTDH